MNEAFLLLSWLAYFYLHSLLASESVKLFFTKLFLLSTPRIYRIGYNLFALTGLLLLLWLQFIVASTLLFSTGLIIDSIAICVMLTGLVIMLTAIRNYDWKGFAGIADEKNYTLVIEGINKYVRHPLYSGTILFVTGYFIWQPYYKNILLWLLMWVYLAIGMIYEERKLVKLYGADYKDYQKRVKKIIPFIW
jgi:methanethiol S-methyltransferase